jgi:tetratricopeptide (TPR) repeat protein
LRTVLEQSTFLEVLPRSRLIDALTGPQTDGPVALDDASAQAAARSVSARYLLLARLLKLGETYLLEIRAVDPSSGVSRFSFKEQVLGRNGIADLLDRGSEKARLLLGEDPASLRRNSIPTGLVTSSPEAWARYSSGVDCIELHAFAGTFGACLTVMKEAVAIDPGFSLAHLRIAVLQFIEAEPLAFQRESVRLAQLHPERVPPHERQRLEGWAAFLAGRDAEAKSLLLAAARASPGDKLAWYLAGEVPYHRDEYAEAVASFREVYALDPNWLDAGQHLVFGIGVSGDIDGLRSMIAGLARQGDKPWAITLACYARLWTDPASAGDTCLKARELGGEESDRFLAIALLNTGQDERLASHLTAMQREEALRSRGTPARGFPWYMQFILLGVEGRWQELERRARVEGDPTSAWFHVTYAELLAGAGDAASVRREALHVIELNPALASSLAVYLAYLGDLPGAADLERFLPAGSPRMKTYQALVRWRQGDLPGAIEDLRRVAAVAPVSVEPPSLPALYLLGEALAEAGRDREAVESLQRFRRIPLLTPTWTWPRSQWLLARSLHRLGNHDGARSILLPLLRAWDHASETQPHLAEARNLGRSLGIR